MAWAAGISAAIGAALDIASTVSNITTQQTTNAFNKEQMALNAQMNAQQIAAWKEQIESMKLMNSPSKRYEDAINAGYGPDGAAQLAGRTAPHMVGAMHMAPMLAHQESALMATRNRTQVGWSHAQPFRPISKSRITQAWLQSQDAKGLRSRGSSMSSFSGFSRSTDSTVLSRGSNASSTSAMFVSDSRPIIHRPGRTVATWVPGSDA